MQALFILPLLMSMLAMAISLLAGVWPGAIIMVDLAMLSLVQAIIAAEAGVKAKVESRAAAINILISNLAWMQTSELLANAIRIFCPLRFGKKTSLYVAVQRSRPSLCLGLNAVNAYRLLRSARLPVAISTSHEALPRSRAWHL